MERPQWIDYLKAELSRGRRFEAIFLEYYERYFPDQYGFAMRIVDEAIARAEQVIPAPPATIILPYTNEELPIKLLLLLLQARA